MTGNKRLMISTFIIILLANIAFGFAGMDINTSTPTPTQNLNGSVGGSSSSGGSGGGGSSGGTLVYIIDSAFNPETITISKGTTVKWVNKDNFSHTITSNIFDSVSLSQGQTFMHIFYEVGTFDYGCSIHPSMKGKVIIIDTLTPTPSPTPTPTSSPTSSPP